MQKNQPQLKGYSYHFSKIISKAPQTATLSNIQPFSPIATPKNVNINFRYHTETQQSDRKGLSFKAERLKTQNCSEKCLQPHKKYTFSLLANEVRQQSLQENKQSTSLHVEFTTKDAFKETVLETVISEPPRQHSILKKPVITTGNGQIEKGASRETFRDRSAKDNLEKQLSELKKKNEHLQSRVRYLQSKLSEKDAKINELTHLINELTKKKVQNSSQSKQEQYFVRNKLRIQPRLCNLQISQIQQTQEPQQHFEKESKEWSTSTITYNYEEEYKQILTFFQIELNQQNFHERLMKHIDSLFKKAEQLTKTSALFKEKQKENVRLGHHLRRLQGENAHFANMANVLAKQYEKAIDLLQFSNREVENMHLDSLNRKYGTWVTNQNDLK